MSGQQINVDLNQLEAEYCGCGCPYFTPRFIIKRLPALLYALPKDEYINVQLLICENCGRISKTSKNQYPGLGMPEVRIRREESKSEPSESSGMKVVKNTEDESGNHS